MSFLLLVVFPENDINGSSVGFALAVGESLSYLNDNLAA